LIHIPVLLVVHELEVPLDVIILTMLLCTVPKQRKENV